MSRRDAVNVILKRELPKASNMMLLLHSALVSAGRVACSGDDGGSLNSAVLPYCGFHLLPRLSAASFLARDSTSSPFLMLLHSLLSLPHLVSTLWRVFTHPKIPTARPKAQAASSRNHLEGRVTRVLDGLILAGDRVS